MVTKWNLIGWNFTHTTGGNLGKCSTHGKMPINLEWCLDYQSDVSFYLDNKIFTHIDDHCEKRKFGWILESKSIVSGVYERVKEEYERLFETYEAIFTHDKELVLLDSRFKFTIHYGYWIKEVGIHPKTKLASGINSGKTMCEGHKWRNWYMEENKQYYDLFGRNIRPFDLKEEVLKDYMFSVNIENGSYASYFSEKLLDCFATGTIPIYKGAPDVGDFFNTDGILFIDDDFSFDLLSADLYYSKMDAIQDNYERIGASCYHSGEDYIFETYREEFDW